MHVSMRTPSFVSNVRRLATLETNGRRMTAGVLTSATETSRRADIAYSKLTSDN